MSYNRNLPIHVKTTEIQVAFDIIYNLIISTSIHIKVQTFINQHHLKYLPFQTF